MLVHALRFGGNTLNGSGLTATLITPGALPGANPIFLPQAQADAVYSGAYTVDVRSVAVRLQITDPVNRYALVDQIKQWFKRGARGDLVAQFVDDGLEYRLDCVVVTPPLADTNGPWTFVSILSTGDSAWRAVTAETQALTVSGTGASQVISVGGNDPTRLSLDITPTSGPATGYLYQQLYRLVNVPGVDYGLRPWCITINHAALVTAGKSQADGDDLRVWLGAAETRRWIAGANTTTCKIWFNVALPAGYSLPLKTSIAASGNIDVIQFEETANVAKSLKEMPASGIVLHNNEWFGYSSVVVGSHQLAGITRGVYGTPLEAHTAGVSFSFLSQPVVLLYGNATISAPSAGDSTYDDTKPLFNLSSSDNTKWVYDATTAFYSSSQPNRTGAWAPTYRRNPANTGAYPYAVKGDAESGNPAMGARGANYYSGSTAKGDNLEIDFTMYCAGGIASVSATGRKYRSSSLFFSTAAFQRSGNGSNWFNLWSEASPTASATWEAWGTHTSVAAASGTKYVRHASHGQFTAQPANASALNECVTATVDFVSGTLPTSALLGEVSNYQMSITIANSANGDSIKLDLPLLANRLLQVDGEGNTLVYDGINAHSGLALNDASRSEWVRLEPGSNTIVLSGTDIGTLSVALKWYRRRLY